MIEPTEHSLTERYAAFADNFTLQDAPPELIKYARLLVLDLLGCAIGGLGTQEEISARRAVRNLGGGHGRASLWGTGLKGSVQDAAMFNGIISHVLELDDFLGIDHTGSVVLPVLFALAEHQEFYDENRFLEAMILSYEIGRRMLDTAGGYSKHNSAGWHTTGTLGAYAAAAAASKYLGLNQSLTVSALGLAGSVAGGTWAFSADGSMSKRFHPGNAAQIGITAAYLAKEGFTGPRWILETDWGGYFAQFASNHECNLTELFSDLGHDLRLGWAGIKPYACCRGCHSAIDAMFEIKSSVKLLVKDVVEIKVTCSPKQHRQLGQVDPQTIAEAQLSMPYAIAIAIQFDTVGTDRFSESAIQNDVTNSLCKRIVFDLREDWPLGKEPVFETTLVDGRKIETYIPVAKGDRINPVPESEVVDKFKQLTNERLLSVDQELLIEFGLSLNSGESLADISNILIQECRLPR